MIVPDTNIFIAYFSSQNNFLAALIDQKLAKQQILFSVVAVGEFLVKAAVYESEVMRKLISVNPLVSVNKEIMEQAVIYRQKALRKSKRSHLMDCFIAATAKINQAILLTLNSKDYPFSDISIKTPQEINL